MKEIMNFIVLGIILVVIIIVIVWPWFLILVAVAGIFLLLLYLDRTRKHVNTVPPLWTWGESTSEVIVKLWTHEPKKWALEYKKSATNGGEDWIEVKNTFDENFLRESDNIPAEEGTRHRFEISDLQPGTKYDYRFVELELKHGKPTPAREDPKYSFYCPREEFEPFKFVVAGDSQQSEVLALLETYM